MVARRNIPAGSRLRLEWLAGPVLAKRGDAVPVRVESETATLHLVARADSAGRAGEVVTLVNTESGKEFQARLGRDGVALLNLRGKR
jgi:flagella basal body P-ring formation protein FlgA